MDQEKAWDPKTFLHRFAVLAISLVITTGMSVAPILPSLEKAFSSYPKPVVDTIATIQQIPAFIVILLSSQLALRFGLKRIISTGILIMGVSGMLPAILNNLWLILASRIIFGIGIGMINSLAVTIIELLYTNNEDQAQMLGNRTAFEPIGVCVFNILIGFLLSFGWHLPFLTYGLIIVVWLIFVNVVPPISMTGGSSNDGKSKKETVNLPVILAALFCAMMTMGTAILNVFTPSIMVDHNLGTAAQSSYVLTGLTIAGVVVGFAFGTFFKFMGRYVLPFGVFLLLVGMLIFNYATNLPMLVVGTIIAGVSYAFSGTYVFHLMSSVAPKNSTGLANSLLLVGCNIGTAISPIVIGMLSSLSFFGGFRPGITGYLIVVLIVLISILGYQLTHRN